MFTEADTWRKFVVPKLQAAGWDNEPHSMAEQRTITDGRIVPVGKGFVRKPSKKVDYCSPSNGSWLSSSGGRGKSAKPTATIPLSFANAATSASVV